MEYVFKELSKREDLVQVLVLVLAIVIGLIVLWLLRILFQAVKNWGSGSGEQAEIIRELAVKNTTKQEEISKQLNLSSTSLATVVTQLMAFDQRLAKIDTRQDVQEQVMASITLVLEGLQKTTSQADASMRAEIGQHETQAVSRSNENLEVAQKILEQIVVLPSRLENIEQQHKKIVASIGDIRKAQREDNQHLIRIQNSVMDAVKDSSNRSKMIQQVLDTLQTMMDGLKALQDKPSELTVCVPSGGESA